MDTNQDGATTGQGGTPARRAGRREWFGLAVLALPTMLIGIDLTVLHLAVPQLAADLNPSGNQLLWITDVYGFFVAGLLVTMGTLGDRIGRRRLLLIGAAAFGLTSLLAAYATSAETLIAARALLGIAGATLMPSTLSLISNMFHDENQRRFAIAVWMTNFMAGGAIGPIIGGALLDHFWWGSAFLVAVPVMVLMLAAGPILLPEFRDRAAGRIDLPSVALSLATMLPVVYGVKELARHGLSGGIVPIAATLLGVLLGILFVRRQRTLAHPLLDLSLFTRAPFSVSVAAQGLSLFLLGGIQFLVLQYLQQVLDLSPFTAGLWALPAMTLGVVGTLAAPALMRYASPGRVVTWTLFGSAIGLLLLTQVGGENGLVPAVTGFALLSLLANPAIALSTDLIVSSVPPERAGTAAAIGETSNELGLALGVALLGSLSTAVYRGHLADAATTLPDLNRADLDTASETMAAAIGVAERVPTGGADLLATAREGFAQGLQVTGVVGAVIMIALAALTWRLLEQRRTPVNRSEEPPAEPRSEIDADHAPV